MLAAIGNENNVNGINNRAEAGEYLKIPLDKPND
jgi:hypothetical protein